MPHSPTLNLYPVHIEFPLFKWFLTIFVFLNYTIWFFSFGQDMYKLYIKKTYLNVSAELTLELSFQKLSHFD